MHDACMRNQYTEKHRSDLLKLVTSGRETVSQAAARLGVKPSTAYYWVRRGTGGAPVRPRPGKPSMLEAAPTFVRVVPRGDVEASIALRVGGAEIRVRRDFDGELLRAVVEALRGGAT